MNTYLENFIVRKRQLFHNEVAARYQVSHCYQKMIVYLKTSLDIFNSTNKKLSYLSKRKIQYTTSKMVII